MMLLSSPYLPRYGYRNCSQKGFPFCVFGIDSSEAKWVGYSGFGEMQSSGGLLKAAENKFRHNVSVHGTLLGTTYTPVPKAPHDIHSHSRSSHFHIKHNPHFVSRRNLHM